LIQDTDIAHSTMSRYLNGARSMPVSVVVTMSNKYGIPLLDGMVAAEYLSEEQATTERNRYGLATMTDQDLAAEVLRRLEAATDSQLAQDMEERPNVTKLSDHRPTVEDRPTFRAAKEHTEDVPEDTP